MHSRAKTKIKDMLLTFLFTKADEWLRTHTNNIIEELGEGTTAYRYKGFCFFYNPFMQKLTITKVITEALTPRAEEVYQFYLEHEKVKSILSTYITNALNQCYMFSEILAVFPDVIIDHLSSQNITKDNVDISPAISEFRRANKDMEDLIRLQVTKNILL